MNLTSLIKNLENKLKFAEKLAKRYDAEAESVRDKLVDIAQIVGKNLQSKAVSLGSPKKKRMSAAGRAKIAAAQRKRWAKFHAKKSVKKSPKKSGKKKGGRKLSATGRANIIAAQRKRWAARKKATA